MFPCMIKTNHAYMIRHTRLNNNDITFFYHTSTLRNEFHSLTWFGDLSYSKFSMPKYESEFLNCPYCSEKMKLILNRDVSLSEPPP